jgi:hypothetical protein
MKKIQIVIVTGVIFLTGSFSVSFAGSAKTISKVNSIIKDNSPYMIESAVSSWRKFSSFASMISSLSIKENHLSRKTKVAKKVNVVIFY